MVADIFREYPSDIICFQEVNWPQFNFLDRYLPEHNRIGDDEYRGVHWEYRPIYVRNNITILNCKTLSLSETPEEISKLSGSKFIRQATIAHLYHGESEIYVVNTHLDFSKQVILDQMGVLIEVIAGLSSRSPVILCGDFNSTNYDKPYRLVTSTAEFQEIGANFKDTADLVGSYSTYHGFNRIKDDEYLDWILFRGGNMSVGSPSRAIEYSRENIYPSDHYPVRAEIILE